MLDVLPRPAGAVTYGPGFEVFAKQSALSMPAAAPCVDDDDIRFGRTDVLTAGVQFPTTSFTVASASACNGDEEARSQRDPGCWGIPTPKSIATVKFGGGEKSGDDGLTEDARPQRASGQS